MELLGIAAIVVVLVVGFIGLLVGWWILRRTLSMIKKLVMLALMLVALGAIVAVAAVGLGLATFATDPPAPIERRERE